MKINEEKISEIRRSVNIVDIISEYIPVEKKGRNYLRDWQRTVTISNCLRGGSYENLQRLQKS